MILNGGDKVIVTFLFWGIFLPLGSCFSLDSRRNPRGRTKPAFVEAFGSTCFVLQVVTLYVLSGYAKSHAVWITDHSAVRHALMNGAYATPLGSMLLQQDGLLETLTVATLYLEQAVIFLILCPVYTAFFRVAIPLLFAAFHLGIALTLDVGLFSYACVIAWAALLPGDVFDWIRGRIVGTMATVVSTHDREPAVPNLLPYGLGVVAMTYLMVGTVFPGQPDSFQYAVTAPVRAFRLRQSWDLYAPHPGFSTRWFAIRAVDDRSWKATVYPWHEKEFSCGADDAVPRGYPIFYLRKYFYGLARKNDPKLFEASCRAFQAYWLPGGDACADWEVVTWTRRHYPEIERDFTRKILYSRSLGKTAEDEGSHRDESNDQ